MDTQAKRKQIRVLHVLGRLDRGGAETMIMNIYRNIDRERIQFDFLIHTNEECDYTQEILALGGKIYSVKRFNLINLYSYIQEWKEFFGNNEEHMIIHGHMRSTASIYLSIAKKFNRKTIAHSHSLSSGRGVKGIVKNILQYPLRYIADEYLACSEDAGEWLFGNKKKYTVIKNGIEINKYLYDPKMRNPIRKKLELEDKFVIGHIGRFCYEKNHEFLINTFLEVYKHNEKAVLILVGEGAFKQKITSQIDKLGLSNKVIFLGVTENVGDILQAMDIFVFPSLVEGLGMVAIEAQTAGLKCIISDRVPGDAIITDLVEQITLELGPVKWAEIINSYDVSYKRENKLREINIAGYDINQTSKKLERIYEELKEK